MESEAHRSYNQLLMRFKALRIFISKFTANQVRRIAKMCANWIAGCPCQEGTEGLRLDWESPIFVIGTTR